MLSNAQIKFVSSLHLKKNRKTEGLFIAEGEKVVCDLMASTLQVEAVYVLEDYPSAELQSALKNYAGVVHMVKQKELERISSLNTPQAVLAVVRQQDLNLDVSKYKKAAALILDDIRDPGNLGTIIRIAEWFGIRTIFCSPTTVECYNPKVVQAAMGSLFRMHLYYTDLGNLLKENQERWKIPVYATMLDGKNIFQTRIPEEAWMIMGNESNGIGAELINHVDEKISIPTFVQPGEAGPESLNVAVASGIICAEWLRPR